ncbi:hypothetical protein CDAR_52251 [Caerostris darwini]|uniref:Uncharacterized protein n=1 Tax=Caerostris darwini TaxID=1538125 RepID=A0AAV4V325_9ARAC|nr:hypothetical protein CDAR_52251 [Caerostris darwini]
MHRHSDNCGELRHFTESDNSAASKAIESLLIHSTAKINNQVYPTASISRNFIIIETELSFGHVDSIMCREKVHYDPNRISESSRLLMSAIRESSRC